MRRVAALLAAVLVSAGVAGCGGDGAEPGASREATLVLDFQPNAVHAGIYAALAAGLLRGRGRRPATCASPRPRPTPRSCSRPAGPSSRSSTSTTSGSPRERGLDVVGVAPIVQRPLAAVIAADRDEVRRPRTSRAERSESPACPPTTRCSTRCSRPTGPTRPPSTGSRSASTRSPRWPRARSTRRRRSGTPRA